MLKTLKRKLKALWKVIHKDYRLQIAFTFTVITILVVIGSMTALAIQRVVTNM